MLVAACDFSTLNVRTNICMNMFLKFKRPLYSKPDYLSKPKYSYKELKYPLLFLAVCIHIIKDFAS